jgi:hypothetical protein
MNARDARKKLEEEQRRKEMAKKNGQQEPTSGERSPNDPADRATDGGKPKDAESGDPRRNDVPACFAALPPEVRDSLAGGRAEDVPEKYRRLIRAFNLWLQKNQKPRR